VDSRFKAQLLIGVALMPRQERVQTQINASLLRWKRCLLTSKTQQKEYVDIMRVVGFIRDREELKGIRRNSCRWK
jgi:hypothetical protein